MKENFRNVQIDIIKLQVKNKERTLNKYINYRSLTDDVDDDDVSTVLLVEFVLWMDLSISIRFFGFILVTLVVLVFFFSSSKNQKKKKHKREEQENLFIRTEEEPRRFLITHI